MFMMKPTYLTAVSLVLFAVCSPAAETKSDMSNDAVRAAITTFRQNPVSPAGRAAGETVRTFAEKSGAVLVEMNAKVTPFLNNPKLLTADRTLLQNAFVVGSIDSQLANKEKKANPYGGVLEVIHTYRQMQKRDPTLSLPGIEHFIKLEKSGDLKAYLSLAVNGPRVAGVKDLGYRHKIFLQRGNSLLYSALTASGA